MSQQPQPLDVAELLILDPATVDPDMANRIGLYYPAKAEALGVLMARDGQNDPIKVVPAKASSTYEWTLVTGLHRLNGCLSANINIAAFVMSANDDLRAISDRLPWCMGQWRRVRLWRAGQWPVCVRGWNDDGFCAQRSCQQHGNRGFRVWLLRSA